MPMSITDLPERREGSFPVFRLPDEMLTAEQEDAAACRTQSSAVRLGPERRCFLATPERVWTLAFFQQDVKDSRRPV